MKCPRCSAELTGVVRFCHECGYELPSDMLPAPHSEATADEPPGLQRILSQEVGAEFRVERELGRGGMATVYLATEVELNRKVAIKVLPPDLTYATDSIERFKREARTVATLTHPNIIPIYRVSSSGTLFWYAMQFLEGESLDELLDQRRRLRVDETIAILRLVADALDYAHQEGVFHRDIKPSNVMLDARGRAIVTDFGVAKHVAAGTLTASGAVLGTPYYMSPEQCSGKALTGASDQYAVGIMAYEMLSGSVPFTGESAMSILYQHLSDLPPPLIEVDPAIPPHVARAVQRALAKDPGERFPTVSRFVDALEGRVTIDTPTTPLPGALTEDAARAIGAFHGTSVVQRVTARARRTLVMGTVGVIAASGLGWALWQSVGTNGDSDAQQAVESNAVAPAASGTPQTGMATITVGTRPFSTITVNGMKLDRNPIANYQVPAGEVSLSFEVTEESGTWTMDTTVTVGPGEDANLGRMQLTRTR